MEYWRVGLRVENGKWFCATFDEMDHVLIESKIGCETLGDSVNEFKKELDDWDAQKRARFLK